MHPAPELRIVQAENLAWLRGQPAGAFDLVYLDPPFNTGRDQRLRRVRCERDEEGGDHTGFGGRRYRTTRGDELTYGDRFDDYLGFLEPRLVEAWRVLSPTGTLFVHLDPRESHYVKVLLDRICGRECFLNEVVWAYDYGGRTKKRWSPKHDVLLIYVRDPERYTYEYEAIDRVPYMAPGLVGPEKARRGKTPTDVWWQTIVSPTGKERTGYPTQKPLAILERIVRVHSRPGDRVLDAFAGSGTTGEAAWRHGRAAVLVDENSQAIEVMRRRLEGAAPVLETPCSGDGPAAEGQKARGGVNPPAART